MLTDLRTRDADPDERRMALLRLVREHEAPRAMLLVGESFLQAEDYDAARIYLERSLEHATIRLMARPYLALTRTELGAGNIMAARAAAGWALINARDLDAHLQAADLLRRTGGEPGPRWKMVAGWMWERYGALLPGIAVYLIVLISPALVGLGRRVGAWIGSYRKTPQSAS
jgi:hypothetical protein